MQLSNGGGSQTVRGAGSAICDLYPFSTARIELKQRRFTKDCEPVHRYDYDYLYNTMGKYPSEVSFIVSKLHADPDRCTAGSAYMLPSGLTGRDVSLQKNCRFYEVKYPKPSGWRVLYFVPGHIRGVGIFGFGRRSNQAPIAIYSICV